MALFALLNALPSFPDVNLIVDSERSSIYHNFYQENANRYY